MAPLPRLLPVLFLACCLCACGTTPQRGRTPPPAAFHPQRIDVPLPPGYVPLTGADQLAVSYAGGRLQRMHSTLRRIREGSSLAGAELVDWYAARLARRNWTPDDSQGRRQRSWTKPHPDGGAQRLVLETGRAGDEPIMRLTLDTVRD